MAGAVSRLPSGISTAMPDGLWGDYRWPGAHDFYEYKNDFSTYAAGDWTVTSTGAGASALADGEGGLLVQTTGATSTNYQANQLASKSFYMVTGYRHFTGHRLKLTIAPDGTETETEYYQNGQVKATIDADAE